MGYFTRKVQIKSTEDEHSIMEIDQQEKPPATAAEGDPFIKFVDYARSIISPASEIENGVPDSEDDDDDGKDANGPGWSWIAFRILKTCISYSSGVTAAILLSELSQAWSEQRRSYAPRKRAECINRLKKKNRRLKLPNTVTIDSIHEKNFLSLNSVLEAVIVDAFVLPGTNIYMLTLGDIWSSNTIDLYLHRRYYDLVSTDNGILKKGREIFLTGCYLRTAIEGFGSSRLLPTEYLVILLDEDQDDDAMLLGAQFCSDSFSSISLDSAHKGVSYSLYARIEYIGPVEVLENLGGIQRRVISLVDDNDGFELKFLLWGEQVVLSNLLSIRSMLAIDKPYIASSMDSVVESCSDFCLEYGSATRLYLVPFIQQEEQVCVALTPNQAQGSKLLSSQSQGFRLSQVTLPCDSQGLVDYSNYPLQSFVSDLHDNMTGIGLYGSVVDIYKDAETSKAIFYVRIEDSTGSMWARLHFADNWSLGRVGLGHTIYISGLTCHKMRPKRLEAIWFENDDGSCFVNLSCLPAMLNSSCLCQVSQVSDLSMQKHGTNICRVWIDQIEHCHVDTRLVHNSCGHFVKVTMSGSPDCEFCCCNCGNETRRAFHLKITVTDGSAKAFAWCTGQTAAEMLQISPDEFYTLPEEEQVMYPCSLESERYIIAIVYCGHQGTKFSNHLTSSNDIVQWEITRAHKI